VTKTKSSGEVWLIGKDLDQLAGLSVWTMERGPPRHHDTWWCNEEAAKAIAEKRRCCKIWHKNNAVNAGAFLRWGWGHAPDSLVAPDSKVSWRNFQAT